MFDTCRDDGWIPIVDLHWIAGETLFRYLDAYVIGGSPRSLSTVSGESYPTRAFHMAAISFAPIKLKIHQIIKEAATAAAIGSSRSPAATSSSITML